MKNLKTLQLVEPENEFSQYSVCALSCQWCVFVHVGAFISIDVRPVGAPLA
jgi:hypothetical protein